ncbi:MAG: DUF1289 domain-containing protein [Casimicrobiaceae bacterium]
MTRPATGTAVPSPCISICAIDQITGLCAGCLRSLDEIAVWSVLDDEEKRAVWASIDARRAAACAVRPSGSANGER